MTDMSPIRAVKPTPKITMIEVSDLVITKLNVRHHGDRDIESLAQSIATRGLMQPLLVREMADKPGKFEVIFGGRRTLALRKIAKDTGEAQRVACIVTDVDDATAIAASLDENMQRLPMDTLNQFDAFMALKRKGLSEGSIAAHFGITEQVVARRLAIAKLAPGIKDLFRRGDIKDKELQILTMASTAKQKEYLALAAKGNAPGEWNLKAWVLGGATIATSKALFDLSQYTSAITSDLFGEESYFANSDEFWILQNAAIDAKKAELEAAGWPVQIFGPSESYQSWEYEKRGREKGGKAVIVVSRDGEVEVHKGVLERKLAAKADKAKAKGGSEGGVEVDAEDTVEKSEMTEPLCNYVDLVRHSAVRAKLATAKGTALRVAVAQMLAGSTHWRIDREARSPANEAIATALEGLGFEAEVAAATKEARSLLGKANKGEEADDGRLVRHGWDRDRTIAIYKRLRDLSDAEVLSILAAAVAETLVMGTTLVDVLGVDLKADVTKAWEAEDTFFSLIRDKDVLAAMLTETAGKDVARDNLTATGKVKRGLIAEAVKGKRFTPRWMEFPRRGYTKRKLTARTRQDA